MLLSVSFLNLLKYPAIEPLLGFIPPYALKEILSALSSNSPHAKTRAYFWTMVTFIAHLSFAQVDLFKSWHTRRCYERTRGQLFCTLHYKSLKRQEVSGRVQKDGEMKNADLGKIINLMQYVAIIETSRDLVEPFNLQGRFVRGGSTFLGVLRNILISHSDCDCTCVLIPVSEPFLNQGRG